jgi:hypothetical protein
LIWFQEPTILLKITNHHTVQAGLQEKDHVAIVKEVETVAETAVGIVAQGTRNK